MNYLQIVYLCEQYGTKADHDQIIINIEKDNNQMIESVVYAEEIDHFHKWRPIINYFANIKISLTNLILKLIIQKSFYSETRLVRLV